MLRTSRLVPLEMETYFTSHHVGGPAIHLGSQTLTFFEGDPKEQAFEARHLAATRIGDTIVVRNVELGYLHYWHHLVKGVQILNVFDPQPTGFLSAKVLDSPSTIAWLNAAKPPNAELQVFLPTDLERQVAEKLGVPLHGTPAISERYGTKSGIRRLAEVEGIPMAPGHICTTRSEVKQAIARLFDDGKFSAVAIKHDLSTGGGWSAKVTRKDLGRLDEKLDSIANGTFIDERDIVVVEGWVESATASVCTHIEITHPSQIFLLAGWQQIIAKDRISYIGAGPLMLHPTALEALLQRSRQLAEALQRLGAVGSYAPDFLITPTHEAILLELNARIPATAFPLSIVNRVRGAIGSGFLAQHIKVGHSVDFTYLAEALSKAKLLITQPDSEAVGVVPFNPRLLQFGTVDLVAIAPTWEQAQHVMRHAQRVVRRVPILSRSLPY